MKENLSRFSFFFPHFKRSFLLQREKVKSFLIMLQKKAVRAEEEEEIAFGTPLGKKVQSKIEGLNISHANYLTWKFNI